MNRIQAHATLKMALAALFPYADPKDDPDRRKAADQTTCMEALDSLIEPPS